MMIPEKLSSIFDQLHLKLSSIIRKWLPADPEVEDVAMLLHELQVHQVELEAQNQELRESQVQLLNARDRYQALYDFAPVGYATLDRFGLLLNLNLTMASYFKVDRNTMVKRPLSSWLGKGEKLLFIRHLSAVFLTGDEQSVELRVKPNRDQEEKVVMLKTKAVSSADGKARTCNCVLIDISREKTAEKALRQSQEELEATVASRTSELTDSVASLRFQIEEREKAQRLVEESEEKYRLLFASEGDAIFLYVVDTQHIIDANIAAINLYGYSMDELKKLTFAHLFATVKKDENRSDEFEYYHSTPDHSTYKHKTKDGYEFPVEVSKGTFIWQGREVVCAIVRDVRERFVSDAKLKLAADVFACTNEAIMVFDPDYRIVMVNSAFTRLTGYSSEEVLGLDCWILMLCEAGIETPMQLLQPFSGDREQIQREMSYYRKDGSCFPAWENISAIKNKKGNIVYFISVFSDISPIKEAKEKLDYLAHHDALTNLPNRLLFGARLEQTLQNAKRHGNNAAVLFIDLDQFKSVNDTMGHDCGDILLQEVAQRIEGCVRDEDTVARLGGDEFTVLLSEIRHEEEAALLATKILSVIKQPVQVGGKQVVISTSIGISLFPRDANNASDLTKAADLAMYCAKEHGRNTYEYYSHELTSRAEERLSLEQNIRHNLGNGNFLLVYQPQFDLVSGEVVGAEALLRWLTPPKGYSSPQRIVSIAEESALIMEIDEWVLRTACAQLAVWRSSGLLSMRTSINVSAMNLMRDHFSTKVRRALEEFCLPPECLELEITESVLHTGSHVITELEKLKELGVTLAIDDFGTGYSSLLSLKHLPIDRIKIDRSFITELPANRSDVGITQAIITLGHNLNLKVIAEGVENIEQSDFLRAQGCDEVQGFWFSKPLAAASIPQFLKDADSLHRDRHLISQATH